MKLSKSQVIFLHIIVCLTVYRRFRGLATLLMKFLCGGASWTLDPHNSMKIQKMSSPACGFFLQPNTMGYFYHSQTFPDFHEGVGGSFAELAKSVKGALTKNFCHA